MRNEQTHIEKCTLTEQCVKKKVAAKRIPSKGTEALCIMWARSAGELWCFHN